MAGRDRRGLVIVGTCSARSAYCRDVFDEVGLCLNVFDDVC